MAITTVRSQGAIRIAATVGTGVVLGSQVTRLTPGHNPVTTLGRTDGVAGEEVVQRQPVIRVDELALGLEHHHLVDVPDGHAKVDAARRIRAIVEGVVVPGQIVDVADLAGPVCTQDDPAHAPSVDPAEIDRQTAIDEHEDVIVTAEIELLPTLVFEPISQLAGEMEVVLGLLRIGTRVTEPHVVDGEEAI